MSPYEIYKKRADEYGSMESKLQKTVNRLSLARLISFVAALVLFVSLSSVSLVIAIVCSSVSLLIFVWLIVRYEEAEKQRVFYKHLATINERELKCIEGYFSDFRDGSGYISRDHPYSYDLDIFGHSSLFQYINRTSSKPASDLLASFLSEAAPVGEIKKRQEAIAELMPCIDWRQRLMTLGYSISDAGNDPKSLMSWLESENIFPARLNLRIVTVILSLLSLAIIGVVISGLPASLLAPILTFNFIFFFSKNRKVMRLHEQVSKSSDLLKSYASIIEMIETERFTSERLSLLQKVFRDDNIIVSKQVKRLSKLVNRLDRRMNVLVSMPLNILFFADIHFCLALEKWKSDNAAKIPQWFEAMSEFEVLSSFANMSFNNPGWAVPVIESDFFVFRSENMGHPLIPARRCITNSIEITGKGKTIIVTGSNMSGKSTFLRTCGINTVLALAGANVCASSFTVSPASIYSSMRISDSLEDNISSFYAELKRLRSIISSAEKDPHMFLLLDEILRGTNSNDRFTGSVALIKQLSGYGTVTMVATHDLKLAELSEEIKEKTDNYHFDVKVSGEELFFDYKLTPGICTSLNASILMKKMGIRV